MLSLLVPACHQGTPPTLVEWHGLYLLPLGVCRLFLAITLSAFEANYEKYNTRGGSGGKCWN